MRRSEWRRTCGFSTLPNLRTPDTFFFLGAAAGQSSAKLQRQRLRRSEWRRTGGIATPKPQNPRHVFLPRCRRQAELRKAAEAAVEKERVEAYWRYCNTPKPQNPRHVFLSRCRCQAELRKAAEAAVEKERVEAYWWYCNTQTSEPQTRFSSSVPPPGRAPQSCRGSG